MQGHPQLCKGFKAILGHRSKVAGFGFKEQRLLSGMWHSSLRYSAVRAVSSRSQNKRELGICGLWGCQGRSPGGGGSRWHGRV